MKSAPLPPNWSFATSHEFVHRGGYSERFRVRLAVALIDPVGCGVACVLSALTRLGFLAAGGLAFGVTAGSLAFFHSRVRIEPPLAYPAGLLPGIAHVPLFIVTPVGGWVIFGERGWVVSRERRRIEAIFRPEINELDAAGPQRENDSNRTDGVRTMEGPTIMDSHVPSGRERLRPNDYEAQSVKN